MLDIIVFATLSLFNNAYFILLIL